MLMLLGSKPMDKKEKQPTETAAAFEEWSH